MGTTTSSTQSYAITPKPTKMSKIDLFDTLDKIKNAIIENRVLKGSININVDTKTNYADQFPQVVSNDTKVNIKIDLTISSNKQIDF
jgi:hypothetical protein